MTQYVAFNYLGTKISKIMSQVRGMELIVVYIIFFQDFALGKEELDHSSHTSSLS